MVVEVLGALAALFSDRIDLGLVASVAQMLSPSGRRDERSRPGRVARKLFANSGAASTSAIVQSIAGMGAH